MGASVEFLKAARAKITDPANWTTEFWARNEAGDCVDAESGLACSWCAVGALDAVTANYGSSFREWSTAFSLLNRVSDEHFGGRAIAEINDGMGHEAVLRLYDLAIARAEASNA